MTFNRRTVLAAATLAALTGAVFTSPALSHGPTPQKTDVSVEIDAPFDAVWEVLADFASIADWHPAVHSASPGENDKSRVLTLDGGSITETLDVSSKERGVIAWRLGTPNPDALAVSSYNDKLMVEPAGDQKTTVRWIGRFYRADTSNFPADGQTDEAAIEAMTRYVETGLAGLEAYFAARRN
jgi:mxaD protein